MYLLCICVCHVLSPCRAAHLLPFKILGQGLSLEILPCLQGGAAMGLASARFGGVLSSF